MNCHLRVETSRCRGNWGSYAKRQTEVAWPYGKKGQCRLCESMCYVGGGVSPVARERFFNRVVKNNLFQLGIWGCCKAPAGSGAEPRRQADFDNNLLKIN